MNYKMVKLKSHSLFLMQQYHRNKKLTGCTARFQVQILSQMNLFNAFLFCSTFVMYGYTVKLLTHSFKSQYLLSDIIRGFVLCFLSASNILSVCMHHYNFKVLSIFLNINNYYPVILYLLQFLISSQTSTEVL